MGSSRMGKRIGLSEGLFPCSLLRCPRSFCSFTWISMACSFLGRRRLAKSLKDFPIKRRRSADPLNWVCCWSLVHHLTQLSRKNPKSCVPPVYDVPNLPVGRLTD